MRAALLVVLLLAGCLRVGGGDDLYLVCEGKSSSPRMAYGVADLLAATRVEGEWTPQEVAAMLDAARRHVVTPRGAPHESFEARLDGANATEGIVPFHATGTLGPHVDVHDLELVRAGAPGTAWTARMMDPQLPGRVRAPASLAEPARAAAMDEPTARAALERGALAGASWDPELPACVRLHVDAAERATVVVNLAQERVVAVQDGWPAPPGVAH